MKVEKRGRKLGSGKRSGKPYSIRFDSDLISFIENIPNKSNFINELVRREKERIEKNKEE